MSQSILFDISKAPARSKGQAMRYMKHAQESRRQSTSRHGIHRMAPNNDTNIIVPKPHQFSEQEINENLRLLSNEEPVLSEQLQYQNEYDTHVPDRQEEPTMALPGATSSLCQSANSRSKRRANLGPSPVGSQKSVDLGGATPETPVHSTPHEMNEGMSAAPALHRASVHCTAPQSDFRTLNHPFDVGKSPETECIGGPHFVPGLSAEHDEVHEYCHLNPCLRNKQAGVHDAAR